MPVAIAPGPSAGDRWRSMIGSLNDTRVRGRAALGELANLFGGRYQDEASQEGLHEITSENLTKKLGSVLPPQIAANTADMAGLGNETLSAGLQAAVGHPVVSPEGFDWSDVAHNRIGQDRGIRALEAQGQPNPVIGAFQDLSGLSAANLAAKLLAGYRGR